MAHPDYLNFVSNVTNSGKNSKNLDCTSQAFCYSKDTKCKKFEKELSDLVINIDGTSYSIPSYGYLVEDFEDYKCVIAVSYLGILANQYVLGDTFLRNFYVSFNYENLTVSLAQNVNAPSSFYVHLVWWAILLIVLGSLILVGVIVAGVMYCRGRGKRATKLTIPEDDDEAEVAIAEDPLLGDGGSSSGLKEEPVGTTMHGMTQGMKVRNINVTDSNMNNTGLLSNDD